MSYLDTPRFHFYGNFFANPSTINNATENYSLTEVYNNQPPSSVNPNSVWWNQMGQAFFRIPGPAGQLSPAPSCAVTGALDANGNAVTSDPLIGAPFVSVISGGPPAHWGRITDLDPDAQGRSLIVALVFQVSLPGATSRALQGTVQPATIVELWGPMTTGATSGLNGAACMYQSVVTDLVWGELGSSPLLQQLHAASQATGMLSIKFVVDNYDGGPTSPTFNYGRITGTVGPYFADEPWHFVAQRKMSVGSSLVTAQGRPLMNNAPFQVKGARLTIDLGNSVSTTGSGAGMSRLVTPNNLGPVELAIDPAGTNVLIELYSDPAVYATQYGTMAGIFTVTLDAAQQAAIAAKPLGVQIHPPTAGSSAVFGRPAQLMKEGLSQAVPGPPAVSMAQVAIAEDPTGYYAAVDFNALRLQKGASAWADTNTATSGTEITGDAQILLICTQYGSPAPNVPIDVTSVQNFYQFANAQGENPPINNTPMAAITFPASVTTDANGRATLGFTANALGPADREARRADIDGQIFCFTHSYTTDNAGGGAITFLVFEDGPVVASPTWWQDVYPVFLQYARLYPFMKGLIDLSSYDSVTNTQFGWAAAIQAMLTLPMADPAFMPVTRDLSLLRRQMILDWYNAGSPLGTRT